MKNFGNIKTAMNDIFVDGIVNKDLNKKKLFKSYLNMIKESEILKTQFLIYHNIENKVESDPLMVNIFIDENVKLLNSFSKDKIIKENQKLLKLIGDDVIDEAYDLSKLHESINTLLMTKRNGTNLDKITENIKNISNFILSNKEKVINEHVDLPPSLLINLMVDKFNEKYSPIDESDKILLKTILQSSNEERIQNYKKIASECLQLIEQKLIGADEEIKNKLLGVQSKLNEDCDIDDTNFIIKMGKLIKLKDGLSN